MKRIAPTDGNPARSADPDTSHDNWHSHLPTFETTSRRLTCPRGCFSTLFPIPCLLPRPRRANAGTLRDVPWLSEVVSLLESVPKAEEPRGADERRDASEAFSIRPPERV